jgi:hypothetical protein
MMSPFSSCLAGEVRGEIDATAHLAVLAGVWP